MSLMCDNGSLFCPFEGCASSCLGSSDVTQRPYHRNCKCSLHDAAAGGSSGVGGKLRRSNSRVKISSIKQGACGDHHQQLVLSNGRRASSFSDLASANAGGGLGMNKSSSFSDLAVMSPPFITRTSFSTMQ